MKAKIICVLLIVCIICPQVAYSKGILSSQIHNTLSELNIIKQDYFSDKNVVSREECIVAIMRAIGVTDNDISMLNGADFTAFVDTEAYSYFGCAYKAKIAFGEECLIEYPTYRTEHTGKNFDFFFFPERAVKLNEVLAFMVRCLENNNDTDLNSTFEKAFIYGLLHNGDNFIKDPYSIIHQDDFCLLLERFLNQNRYKYFEKENKIFRMNGLIDIERSLKYIEMLKQRGQTNNTGGRFCCVIQHRGTVLLCHSTNHLEDGVSPPPFSFESKNS